MKDTFDYQDGKLCIKSTDTLTDEPILAVRWYPIGSCTITDCEDFVGQPAYYQRGGMYSRFSNGRSIDYRLERGGDTVPFKFKKIIIEKPVSKRQIRWRNGQWQALFKTGWKSYGNLAVTV